MDRVNLPFFLELGATLKLLGDFPQVTQANRLDCIIAGMRVSAAVRELLEAYPDLDVCRVSGLELIAF